METPTVSDKDLAAIHSLDTAKMTLRWALERMRLLEEKNASLQRRFEESEANLRAHALAARGTAAVQGEEAQSQARKMQSLLAEYEKALADLRTLRAREGDVEQERSHLERKRSAMNEDFLRRKELLERRSRTAQEEFRARDIRRESSVEEELVERRMELDGEYVSRELALRSAQRQLAEREMALLEMEARLEDRLRARKDQLEADTLRLREDLRADAEHRLLEWEKRGRELKTFETRKESVERAALAEQARLWEALAREGLAKIETLERTGGEARDTLLRQAAELKEPRALRLEMESLRAQAGGLRESLQAAEERIRGLEAEVEREGSRSERFRTEAEAERSALNDAHHKLMASAELSCEDRIAASRKELERRRAAQEESLKRQEALQEEELERRRAAEEESARKCRDILEAERRALEKLEAGLRGREESLQRAEASLREHEERLLACWSGKQEELAGLRRNLVEEIDQALRGEEGRLK